MTNLWQLFLVGQIAWYWFNGVVWDRIAFDGLVIAMRCPDDRQFLEGFDLPCASTDSALSCAISVASPTVLLSKARTSVAKICVALNVQDLGSHTLAWIAILLKMTRSTVMNNEPVGLFVWYWWDRYLRFHYPCMNRTSSFRPRHKSDMSWWWLCGAFPRPPYESIRIFPEVSRQLPMDRALVHSQVHPPLHPDMVR